jgi:hypothetical protein
MGWECDRDGGSEGGVKGVWRTHYTHLDRE